MQVSKMFRNVDADRAKLLSQDSLGLTPYDYPSEPIAEISPRQSLFIRLARPALKATLAGGLFMSLSSGVTSAKSLNELSKINDHISEEIDKSELADIDKKIGSGLFEIKDLYTISSTGKRIINHAENKLRETSDDISAGVLGLTIGLTASGLSAGGLLLANKRRKAKTSGLYNSSWASLYDSSKLDHPSRMNILASKHVSRIDDKDDSEVFEIRDSKKFNDFVYPEYGNNKLFKYGYNYLKYVGYGVLTAVALSTPVAEEAAIRADDAVSVMPGKDYLASKVASLADPMVIKIKEDTTKSVVEKLNNTMPYTFKYAETLGIKENDIVEIATKLTENIKPSYEVNNERTEIFSDTYYKVANISQEKVLSPPGLKNKNRSNYYILLALPFMSNLLTWLTFRSRYGKKTLVTENFLNKHQRKAL